MDMIFLPDSAERETNFGPQVTNSNAYRGQSDGRRKNNEGGGLWR